MKEILELPFLPGEWLVEIWSKILTFLFLPLGNELITLALIICDAVFVIMVSRGKRFGSIVTIAVIFLVGWYSGGMLWHGLVAAATGAVFSVLTYISGLCQLKRWTERERRQE